MKRIKRCNVKSEAPETSTSYNREQEIHDLAYYIHDRVELMHQVFSVIKYKELKAMVPASIRNISLNDLQELCTEELLGISSKRLCAILDGAEPPSDTESSSPSPPREQMETISLDSISSDDEILSQTSNKKKKHKHRRHSKPKAKRKKSKDSDEDEGEADKSKATRAGLTVLELLELQARARAIRAQLQQEQQKKPASEAASKEPAHSSDNEVEIKEEPPEVVEISSDEEKPNVEDLQKKIIEETEAAAAQVTSPQATVTKRINDLVITVPQKTKQKIKLNRNKSIHATIDKPTRVDPTQNTTDTPSVATPIIVEPTENKIVDSKNTKKDKSMKKKKGKKNVSKDDIDNDEITLQLSDTEKMDLLEDLDRKHYDSVSSESSSESSSDSDVSVKEKDNKDSSLKEDDDVTIGKDIDSEGNAVKDTLAEKGARKAEKESEADNNKNKEDPKATSELLTVDITKNTESKSSDIDIAEGSKEVRTESGTTVQNNKNTEIIEINLETQSEIIETTDPNITSKDTVADNSDATKDNTTTVARKDKDNEEEKETENNLSEGELSERESSEIEAVELKPEVVCISDEEGGKKAKKKKKKKEKKSKKDKKSKKKDFRETADQNFYEDNLEMENTFQGISKESKEVRDNNTIQSVTPSKNSPITKTIDEVPTEIIDKVDLTAEKTTDKDVKPIKEEVPINNDVKIQKESAAALSDSDIQAVYEIMELSDDSSCCEVECTTTLSKEPTASEIQALSAKIDEIERVEIITDKEIRVYEREQENADIDNIEHISWKDRYLDSKKVKKVLTTANILNALRKKNIELKKKLAESKMDTEETVPEEKEVQEEIVLEEGSIEHYNTLEALTTYVDPIKEVPKDLKKDAKLLLKMYKKLLKYNDINKPEDPNKKKKRKKKKIKKDTMNTEERKDLEVVENLVSVENKEISVEIGEELENELNSIEELVNKEGD